MKIAIVTQYYPPDPPSWIAAGVAQGLRDRGHEVRVLTTFPHYETGRIAAGYRQQKGFIEEIDGISVRRVLIVPSHSGNPIGRIANYLSFALSSRRARGFVRDVDVVYAYATPMTVAEAPRVWARSLGLPFVLHVQDLWPESVTGSGLLGGSINRAADLALSRWLRRVYARAAVTIAIAPTMRSMLVERGVPENRARVVLNWSNDADHLAPTPRLGSSGSSGVTLLYAGNLGRMQDVSSIILAAALLSDVSDLRIRIAGFGVEEPALRELARATDATSVEFLGHLSREEIAEEYARADFQLVTLRDLEIFDGTIPSKFQAGLARGLPVITTVRGDLTRMVSENELGFIAKPEDPESLAHAIRLAHATTPTERAALSRGARSYYDMTMSKSSGIDAIEAALVDAVAGEMGTE